MGEVSKKSIEQGKRILALRIEKGLLQEELSKLSGISVPYISRLEKGHVNVTQKTLNAMSKALDVSIEYLENGFEKTLPHSIEKDEYELISYDTQGKPSFKRIRKSEPHMKDKDFARYRKDIQNSIDDILYNSDNDMIISLKVIIEKISDYVFARNTMEHMLDSSKQLTYDRCMKYIEDIYNELEYQIAHHNIED